MSMWKALLGAFKGIFTSIAESAGQWWEFVGMSGDSGRASCASGSACGPPLETRTTCSRAPSCEGNVYTVWDSTCDAIAEDCIDTVARALDCDDQEDPDQCDPTGRAAVISETCTCDAASGCDCVSSTTVCRAAIAECVSASTLRTYSAGCDVATASCTMTSSDRICRYGCVVDPAGPDYCHIG